MGKRALSHPESLPHGLLSHIETHPAKSLGIFFPYLEQTQFIIIRFDLIRSRANHFELFHLNSLQIEYIF